MKDEDGKLRTRYDSTIMLDALTGEEGRNPAICEVVGSRNARKMKKYSLLHGQLWVP